MRDKNIDINRLIWYNNTACEKNRKRYCLVYILRNDAQITENYFKGGHSYVIKQKERI